MLEALGLNWLAQPRGINGSSISFIVPIKRECSVYPKINQKDDDLKNDLELFKSKYPHIYERFKNNINVIPWYPIR